MKTMTMHTKPRNLCSKRHKAIDYRPSIQTKAIMVQSSVQRQLKYLTIYKIAKTTKLNPIDKSNEKKSIRNIQIKSHYPAYRRKVIEEIKYHH